MSFLYFMYLISLFYVLYVYKLLRHSLTFILSQIPGVILQIIPDATLFWVGNGSGCPHLFYTKQPMQEPGHTRSQKPFASLSGICESIDEVF